MNSKRIKYFIISGFALLAFFVIFLVIKMQSSTYKVPMQMNDGWETEHVKKVGLDEEKLSKLVLNILINNYRNIHSILIIKNNKLVFEEYFSGKDINTGIINYNADETHQVMSVTKSITSALIGIAIDNGMIKGTNEQLVDFFPEKRQLFNANGKTKITLKDLLSMTAGFSWDEGAYLYSDYRNPYNAMLYNRGNTINYILSQPLVDQPGYIFTYNGGLPILAGVIIEKRSSMKIKDFADKYLFMPLGITKYTWLPYWDNDEKVTKTDTGLNLRPRDMAKFGYLFLNRGKWKERQIISVKWIEEATKEQIYLYKTRLTGYGYFWWLYSFEKNKKIIKAYVADGWGGQRIFVVPDLDMIVVVTAGNHSLPHMQVFEMMYKLMDEEILSAVKAL